MAAAAARSEGATGGGETGGGECDAIDEPDEPGKPSNDGDPRCSGAS
jgi:hypothetical protein